MMNSTSTTTDSSERIYHESQSLLRCGLHAINSFLQNDPTVSTSSGKAPRTYTKDDFERIAQYIYTETLQLEGKTSPNVIDNIFHNPYRHWLGIGNYDINILLRVLMNEGYSTQWIDKRLITGIVKSSTTSSSSSLSPDSRLLQPTDSVYRNLRKLLWDTTVSLSPDTVTLTTSSSAAASSSSSLPILHGFLINIPSSVQYASILSGPYDKPTNLNNMLSSLLYQYIVQPVNDTLLKGRHWFIVRITKNYRWYNLDSHLSLPYEFLDGEVEIVQNLVNIAQANGEIIRIYKESKE